MKCKKHPKYKAIRKPKRTEKYPRGCSQCWKVWHDENDTVDFMKPWEEIAPGLYSCNYGKTYDLV